MRKFKSRFAVLLCSIAIAISAAPALGWEVELTGSMTWTYEFYTQTGNQGFFGPYNIDNDAIAATANLNYWWNGARIAQNLVTGQDASRSYFYVNLDPKVKINPALRFEARIRLGQWNVPQTGYYYAQDAAGTDNAASEAQWTMFWATADLPWGTFEIGKRRWKFGLGLQYDGSDGLTTESANLDVPYGPLHIGLGFYPHRPAKPGASIALDPYAVDLSPISIFTPASAVSGFMVGPTPVVPPYFNHADKSGGLTKDMVGYVLYSSGPLQTGVLGSFGSYHIGPEATLRNLVFRAAPLLAQDSDFFHGTLFTRYNNGGVFFHGEAAWVYWTDRLSGAAVVPPSPRYTEQWRYMAETGMMCGPSRLTALAAWSPGPDRRNGALIGKQSAAFVWHPGFDIFLGNYDVFRPYSFILTYNYGTGFNAYNLSLDGYLRDAWVLAGRLDYAVAANLNFFGTFLWAERTSNGYGWGCISPNAPLFPDGNVAFRINGNVPTDGSLNPNIPDKALGWEVDAGVDWQLLEGLTVGFLGGYWHPGRWFSYACIDRSVVNWFSAPGAANSWGTRPTKEIDPIFAGQFTMSFAF